MPVPPVPQGYEIIGKQILQIYINGLFSNTYCRMEPIQSNLITGTQRLDKKKNEAGTYRHEKKLE